MDESVEELLAEFVERREVDPNVTVDSFVAEHPSCAEELRAALRDLQSAEDLFPTTPFSRPERIGDWRVLGELGRGGAGRVLRVAHGETGDVRALKILAHGAGDERALARLEREGDLLRALDHPNVVRVHDVGTSEHGPWIVMDLVEGPSLAERLADARSARATPPLVIDDDGDPWSSVASFGADLAGALAAAHERGLLHRDVKPSNILIDEAGAPILIDFGLAAAEDARTLTRTGDLIGTPHYMAPEQARGDRATARTDVWGLGAMLWELATLRTPNDAKDPLAAIERLRRARPRRLDSGSGVPRPLARVIDRALSFRPERRFSGPAEIERGLRAIATGSDPGISGSSWFERIEDRARERPTALTFALGAIVVALVSLALFLTTGRGPEPRDFEREITLGWLAQDRDVLEALADDLDSDGATEWAKLARGLAGRGEPPIDSSDAYVAAIARGEVARKDKRHDDAFESFEAANDLNTSATLPTVAMGHTARSAGDMPRTISEWSAAIRLVPESAHLRRRLGKVLRTHGDPNEAIECFRAAAKLDDADWRNHAELARALAMSVDEELRHSAIPHARRAQEVRGEPVRLMQNVEAAILDELGRHAEAREIHLAILEKSPEHSGTWNNIGMTYLSDCMYPEARDAFERSLALDDSRAGPTIKLAEIACGTKGPRADRCPDAASVLDGFYDPDDAFAKVRKALETEPTSPVLDASIEIARCIDRVGELADVLEELVRDREIDETAVMWLRAAEDLRDEAEDPGGERD